MNRRDLLAAALALAGSPALAQPPPLPDIEALRGAMDGVNQGRYVPLLKFVSTPPGYDQYASFVGAEELALAKAAGAATAPDLAAAAAEDAIEAIVAGARGRRVVMLNEAHVSSRHRNFLARVARALRPEGFTHLAAETFSNFEAPPAIESYRAGMPFNSRYGTYIHDPVFAEAVREAAELGYRFCTYEQRRDQSNPADPADIPTREKAQASNFAAELKRFPEARFLVFVGYSHIREIPTNQGVLWFAGQLKADTGVDPLTITQAYSGSFGPHAPDSPATRAILDKFSPRTPIVARIPERVLFATNDGNDLAVVHPLLPDVDGRPGWLAQDSVRKRLAVPLPQPSPAGHVLAHATHAADPDLGCIPADLYRLKEGSRELVFYLRPGQYRLRIETEAGFTPVREVTV